MSQIIILILGMASLALGSILGYFTRQSIAKRDWKTIEAKIQKRIEKVNKDAEEILFRAKDKATAFLEKTRREESDRRREIIKTEQLLLKKENAIDKKSSEIEQKEQDIQEKIKKARQIKEGLENLRKEALEKLEKISGMDKETVKAELLANTEKEYQKDILERMRKLEMEGRERFEKRAKEILASTIQGYALPQAQEITTTTLALKNEEIKGRIIGKEGRNIRTLERLTGVEVIIDETPEMVVISGFDPVRRQIAKYTLEKLMQDGRIQPARIEEKVEEAKREILSQIMEAGEAAAYEFGLIGMEAKLVQLLGRLKFRTSYGQNVLMHSMEVAWLAAALAEEIGANSQICKKAGLFHDIGKSIDRQIEGSHVDIGIKILERFKIEKEVINAMKSHHEEYPAESIEATLVQVADQISGARPGARKETIENYIKRLSDLESLATSYSEVKDAWALQAGREIRVFVRPEMIDDLGAKKLARAIANKIQQELKYPGEIKINVIRETRITEYAK